MKNHSKKFSALCLAFIIAALSACSASGYDYTVATDGSTSMEKLIGSLGEAFTIVNKNINFTYNPTGSSAGITALTEGKCDIGLSSRYLTDEEKGNGLVETVIAFDAIAVIVNTQNDISDLSSEQISSIYKGEITNWNEIGGNDGEIVLIGREAGSGTRDGFEVAVDAQNSCKYRQELTSAGDVIAVVSENPNAVGYASLASVKESVKVLSVGGIVPSDDSIREGSYKLQRPFILITKNDTELNEGAQMFFDYATSSDAYEVIISAGAVPAGK